MNAQNRKEFTRLLIGLSAALMFAATVPTLARVAPATLLSWTNTAMGSVPLAAASMLGGATAAANDATQLKFKLEMTTCTGGQIQLKVGTTVIQTVAVSTACNCNNPIAEYTFTDAATLALVNANACVPVAVTQVGSSYTGWIKAEITRPSGIDTQCLVDRSGSNCTTMAASVCVGPATQTNGLTFQPDSDGDGVNNCTDLDNDNDGTNDSVDNCPTLANPTQADANNNGTGDACDVKSVVAVPWLGTEALPHQVVSGSSLTLQAVATKSGTDDDAVVIKSATWDPGDGSGPLPIASTNSLVLELNHVYSGAVGQPFTATVSVVDFADNVFTDTFKVVIGPDDRETKVNMAIDKGLWNLHKNMQRTTSDGLASGFWTGHGNFHMSSTASTVQAYAINNHRESGDATKDPYVNNVKRGMRYILSLQHGALQHMAIGLQNVNDPPGHPGDHPEVGQASPNGYGLVVLPNDHSVYLTGQVIDAIVASATPDKTAETGQNTYVKGRKYIDIVQDMLDGYSYGMNDTVGGWHYVYNAGDNDTSSSHWWAIGVLAAEVWGLDAPEWVKTRQKNIGIPKMQIAPPGTAEGCYFGYTGNFNNFWGDNQTNVTAGGLILMNADDVPQSDARFQCAMKWLDSKWTATNSWGNFYTMYQTAKAMRTARNGSGGLQEIELLNGTRNWYNDYADYLIANQNSFGDGSFRAVTGGIGPSYIQGNLATSWGVIILSPSLFELPPAAACVADPNSLGTAGGLVNFSAAASTHPDTNATIVSYAWDFGDGSPAGSGVTTSHTYGNPGTFPTVRQAKVTVTDSNGLTDSAFCPVTIIDTNVPPNANAGGPYTMCMGTSLALDGSTSVDADGTINAYRWSYGPVINFSTPDATTATVDATAAFTSRGPGTYNIGLQVTDDLGATNAEFTTVTVLASNNPQCNQPPDAVDDAASTFSGTAVDVSVLANDTDADVPANTLIVTETTQGANGSVTTNGTTATYTPALGFFGTDTFTYTISDGKGGTDTAIVTVTVSRRTATVTAGSGTKVYSTADPAMPPTSTGFLPADGITLSQSRAIGEDVGNYATNATAAGATLANYDVTYTAGNLAITPADTVTVVSCPASVVFNGSAFEVCTASVTGAGGLNAAVSPVTYTDNVNAGIAGATATYAGGGNYNGSTGTGSFTITPAPTTTVVSCPASVVYSGSPFEVCSANVTGAGGLDQGVSVTYSNNVNVGTAGASATFGGGGNYSGSTGSATFEITAASTSASVTAPTITYAANGLVTVTVTSASGTVVGNVSLTVDGGAAMTQALSGGSATFTVNNPNAGGHALAATYAAQGNFSASSATGTLQVNPAPTATTLTSSPSPQAAGQTVTLTATVVAVAPGSGVPTGSVTFYDGATAIGTAAVNGSGVAVFTTTTLSNGPHTITAQFAGNNGNYLPSSSNTASQLIYGYPAGGGTFVIGNNNATLGNNVMFWGAQWEKNNSMTGGASNNSFKGYAVSPNPPTVGATFTAAPGNSAPSPASVPEYIGIIVTSKVTKSGSNITGTIVKLVVVKVNPGYAGNPGNAGTGTIVAILP